MALNDRTSSRGHTLAEMVIASAILGVLTLALSGLLVFITRFQRQATARYEVQRNARTAMDVVNRFVSGARGRSVVIDRADAQQPFYSRITFTDVDGNSHALYQQGTRLLERVVRPGGTSDAVVAENLREAVFSYPMSGDTSQVAVALAFEEKTVGAATQSFELSLNRVRIQNPDAL